LEAVEVTVGGKDPYLSNMHFPVTTLFSSMVFAILASSQVVSLDKNVRMCDDSFGIPSAVPGGFSNVDCDGEDVKDPGGLIQIPGAEIVGVTRQVVAGEKSVFFVVNDDCYYVAIITNKTPVLLILSIKVQDEMVYRFPIFRQLEVLWRHWKRKSAV
jgi:hypothetical protein